MSRSIVLVGGPDSGKTNYIGRLWRALVSKSGALHEVEQPADINFVMEVTDHLFAGQFAPRSERTDARREFEVIVAAGEHGEPTRLVVPDKSGELWRTAVMDCEIDAEWMDELQRADGAILFVRVGSDQDVRALDWVSSRRMLETLGNEEEGTIPTQVMLCELIRFLELSLATPASGKPPSLALVVTAWDLVDEEKFKEGPFAYLEREYPLLAGRIEDIEKLNVRVFGLSVVGGDLKSDEAYRKDFLESGLDESGWVAVQEDGVWGKDPDLTIPVAWAMGF